MKLPLRPALLILCAAGHLIFSKATAQQHSSTSIVYDITVKKNNGKAGIEETYNGGTKAVFISNRKARIRLTSLMRVQSIFFDTEKGILKKATVIKESGKNKYLFRLAPADWKIYNKKYDSLACDTSFTDSLVIEGYRCRKAVIKPEDEREVTVYYTDSIKLNYDVIEPLFRCIKGTVLQYEASTRKGTITFKASQVSLGNIESKIFAIPSKGVVVKKYNPNKKLTEEAEQAASEEEE
jgi:hypothetical protein